MSRGFDAIKTVTIDAPRAKVWDALTNPAKVKQYMHGTDMSTDWTAGGPIIWRGEWKGHSYEDKGTVLAFEPERLLRYTHWSPMGGSEDKPENYHTVTYELIEEGGNDDADPHPRQQRDTGRGRQHGREQLGTDAGGPQEDCREVGLSSPAPSASQR